MTLSAHDLAKISILLWRSEDQRLAGRFEEWRAHHERMERYNEEINAIDEDHMRFFSNSGAWRAGDRRGGAGLAR
ncbi:MAG: hypothetical protein JOZ36_09460 [Acidobacteria bacterium]|nr:hypothetical protein [Acidobacteriota bacterium]